MNHIEDLRIGLSQAMLQSAPNPGGNLPEEQKVDRLVGAVRAHDVGEISSARLRTIFENNPVPDYDWQQWLASAVDAGVYDPSVLTDTEEWDDNENI